MSPQMLEKLPSPVHYLVQIFARLSNLLKQKYLHLNTQQTFLYPQFPDFIM